MYRLDQFPPPASRLVSAQPSWVVGPYGFTDSSPDIQQDLFWALVDLLDHIDPYGKTWEMVVFGLWTKGAKDVTLIFVQPGTKAHTLCSLLDSEAITNPIILKGT